MKVLFLLGLVCILTYQNANGSTITVLKSYNRGTCRGNLSFAFNSNVLALDNCSKAIEFYDPRGNALKAYPLFNTSRGRTVTAFRNGNFGLTASRDINTRGLFIFNNQGEPVASVPVSPSRGEDTYARELPDGRLALVYDLDMDNTGVALNSGFFIYDPKAGSKSPEQVLKCPAADEPFAIVGDKIVIHTSCSISPSPRAGQQYIYSLDRSGKTIGYIETGHWGMDLFAAMLPISPQSIVVSLKRAQFWLQNFWDPSQVKQGPFFPTTGADAGAQSCTPRLVSDGTVMVTERLKLEFVGHDGNVVSAFQSPSPLIWFDSAAEIFGKKIAVGYSKYVEVGTGNYIRIGGGVYIIGRDVNNPTRWNIEAEEPINDIFYGFAFFGQEYLVGLNGYTRLTFMKVSQ